MRVHAAFAVLLLSLSLPVAAQRADSTLAIVGATLIDGNGGPPVADAVVLVGAGRIVAVGPRTQVAIPQGARIVEATGRYLLPGFIDTNVHLSLYSGLESMARYQDRFTDLAIEGAQLQLKYGITSVRDSYGMLKPLKEARDRINRGEVVGSRILFAGNIVGWGGPWSYTFTGSRQENLSLFQEQMNDAVAAGGGEELMNLTPDELRVAINKYLDQGVDFVKYGGTSHAFFPAMLGFSEAAQIRKMPELPPGMDPRVREPLGPRTPTAQDLAYERIARAGLRSDGYRFVVPGIRHVGVSDLPELAGPPSLRATVGTDATIGTGAGSWNGRSGRDVGIALDCADVTAGLVQTPRE